MLTPLPLKGAGNVDRWPVTARQALTRSKPRNHDNVLPLVNTQTMLSSRTAYSQHIR